MVGLQVTQLDSIRMKNKSMKAANSRSQQAWWPSKFEGGKDTDVELLETISDCFRVLIF